MKPAQPWNNWQVFLLYYVDSLETDSEIKGHYSDFVIRELHALLKSGKDGPMVIRSPLMIWRKFTCVFSLALSAWILFIQPFQLQCWKSGSWPFNTHPAAQERGSVSQRRRAHDGKQLNGVHPCVFVPDEGKNLYVSCLHDHSFNTTIPTVCYCRQIMCWGWCWRDNFHQEWKGVLP